MTQLKIFKSEYTSELVDMIIDFYKIHNVSISQTDAALKIADWSKNGHALFLIECDNQIAGFLHLGERGGGKADWLEDIYVKSDYRHKGIASSAIAAAEQIVRSNGSTAMYIEVVPTNSSAIKLYYNSGFDTINTVTLCKNFDIKETVCEETPGALKFKITKPN